MSKEFEEIVLKKLEKLDSLENEMKETKAAVTNLETEMKETKAAVTNLESEMKETKTSVKKLELEVKDMGEVLIHLNNRFTVFDVEINKKIDTLFDAITVNNDKHDVFEKSIVSLNTKTFNHDIRISNLEDKVLTA